MLVDSPMFEESGRLWAYEMPIKSDSLAYSSASRRVEVSALPIRYEAPCERQATDADQSRGPHDLVGVSTITLLAGLSLSGGS